MLIFLTQHVGCFGLLLLHPTWTLAFLTWALFLLLHFGVTAANHRYFTHRSFKAGRAFQGLLAFLGHASNQGSIADWVQNHENHHRYTDKVGDPHSPVVGGLWWSYLGWAMHPNLPPCPGSRAHDFDKFPEIRFLDRFPFLGPLAMGGIVFLAGKSTSVGAWPALACYCLAMVISNHVLFAFNIVGHAWGIRRFDTPDQSRNQWLVAILTLGEGWHNNHHYYQSSCCFGARWWEIDLTYCILRALAWAGLVWDLKVIPQDAIVHGTRRAPPGAPSAG